ncbi:hypothetical protein ASPCAL14475 [Aspergillus calidoustus]|uniref:Myb-like domain-containing protein n=1 Tax=Aspergillus calidoustus TaxID=454130 RepID=A0A0U5CJV8_ASPCI|nr:hypothetical protein ASPCAL14475 [Aspergillus calidoustus]
MNQYRCARIAVDLILSKLPETMQRDNDIQTITSNLRHSVTWLFRPRGSVFDRMSSLVLTIPWFMFVLAASAASSSETQGWVKDILCMIREKTSIGQSSVVLNLLDSDNHTLLRPRIFQLPTEQSYLVQRIETETSTTQPMENTGGEAASQDNPKKRKAWPPQDVTLLKELRTAGKTWDEISAKFGGKRSAAACRLYYQRRRGLIGKHPWKPAEDTLLYKSVTQGKSWDRVSEAFGGKRTRAGCQRRWSRLQQLSKLDKDGFPEMPLGGSL